MEIDWERVVKIYREASTREQRKKWYVEGIVLGICTEKHAFIDNIIDEINNNTSP